MVEIKTPSPARAHRSRGATSLSWILLVVGLALIATIALALRTRTATREAAQSANEASADAGPVMVPPEVMKNFDNIPAETWNRVGTTGARMPINVGDEDATDEGKAVVLYIGAGYCPYCAAARWSMIAALSRFGEFSGLTYSTSSSMDVYPSSPTFSFYGATYSSDYLELQSVELASEVMMPNGRYAPLENPSDDQVALLQKYDGPPYIDEQSAGGIPFILVGGKYMWSGSPFSPQVLANQTQPEIAATLPGGSGPAARAILANALVFTATVCSVNGGQPAEVCSDPAVQQAMEALPSETP